MSILKGFFKDRPFQFSAPFLALTCFMVSMFVVEDPILQDIARGLGWLVIGFQWMAASRSWSKFKEKALDDDKLRIAKDIKEPFMPMNYLVPTESNHTTINIWNRWTGRTPLRLYTYIDAADAGSYSKIHATKKEMFEMRLRGFIATTSPQLAWDGLTFLNTRKRQIRR